MRKPRKPKAKKYWFEFDAPPAIGYEHDYYGHRLRLIKATPHTKKAGEWVLVWLSPDGRTGRTLLRGQSVWWDSKYVFDFETPPEIGFIHDDLVLIGKAPYIRKSDGAASFILTWRDPMGRTGTSGLRSASVIWSKNDGR